MTLREFLRLNLSDTQRRALYTQTPTLMAGIDDRSVQDRDFALRIIRGDDEALWLLWFCLQSSYFVRLIRMRSKHECGSPCNLVDFEELPCRWSARVLSDYFTFLTSPGGGVLETFCGEDLERSWGVMDWVAVRFHEDFHVHALRQNGFVSLEDERLPPTLRQLFKRDARFRTIFVNRWLWGLTGVEDLAEAIRPVLPPETLLTWVAQVDDAILDADPALFAELEAQQRLRLRSGIPPRGQELARSR